MTRTSAWVALFLSAALVAGCGGDASAPPAPDTPVVKNVSASGASGNITVTYDLEDPQDDTCSILVEYRGGTAGATWTAALVYGQTQGLVPGAGKSITWLSATDEAGTLATTCEIRITPSDAATGTAGTSASFALDNHDTVVTFPDANVEAAIRAAIAKASGDIYASELLGLTALDTGVTELTDLSGIEYCADLEDMTAYGAGGLGPVAGLTALTRLHVSLLPALDDLTPLTHLTNLTELNVGMTGIDDADTAIIASLTNLTILWIGYNSISDLSFLSGLTGLTELHLDYTNITDLGPLAALTGLTTLSLGGNNGIVEITALVQNCDAGGLGSGDTVVLTDCSSLSVQATGTDIPYLEGNGVTVTQ